MQELALLYIGICLGKIFLDLCSYQKRIWNRDIYEPEERRTKGFYKKIFCVLKRKDEDEFRKITRMGVGQFELLLNLLKERLTKISNRKPIEPESRLALTLL